MNYGCIGEHLPHSFSKEIHALIGDYAYELKELTPEQLPGFLTARDFRGVNVTIPYKQAVIPFLDRLDGTAREIGAVNTIVNRNGTLWGYNTDLSGLLCLFRHAGVSPEGGKALILGTGGTSRTAACALKLLGAREILKVSRSARDGAVSYEEALRFHPDAGCVLNTTPCGMFPHPEEQPLSLKAFKGLQGLVDVVYNPLRTRLVLEARSLGIPAEGGLYMLVAQAVRASELFLDTTYPETLTDRIYASVLRQKENIVLIGMPGSGKTAAGRILARRLGRRFLDSDRIVAERAGKSIPEIFRDSGETAFRALEAEVIRELSSGSGTVISTGGGAVLNPENVAALRRNGRLFWLNRPLGSLRPTDDRPLADTADKMARLFSEREPVYRAAADEIVPVSGTPEQTAEIIESR